jgi:hypothetical protein
MHEVGHGIFGDPFHGSAWYAKLTHQCSLTSISQQAGMSLSNVRTCKHWQSAAFRSCCQVLVLVHVFLRKDLLVPQYGKKVMVRRGQCRRCWDAVEVIVLLYEIVERHPVRQ